MIRFSLRWAAAIVVGLVAIGPATAQTTYTWTGGDADEGWFSPLNWSASGPGSSPPISSLTNTFLVLSGNTRTTNDLDYSFSAFSLTFDAAAGPFVVNSSSGETLTLGAGGISIAAGNANNQTFNAKLALGANQAWTNDGSGLFTVGGDVANGGFALTVGGTGNSTFGGIISGTGGLIKLGGGVLTLLNGSNSYAGGTTVNAGTLRLGAAGAAGGTGAPILIQGTNPILEGAVNTATNFGASLTVAANARFRSGRASAGSGVTHTLGTLSIGAQTLTIEPGVNVTANTTYGVTVGATTLTGTPTVLVTNNGTAAGTFTISGAVAGGTNGLTIDGAGNAVISGQITMSGALTRNTAGTVTVSNLANSTTFTGPITLSGGAVLSYPNQLALGTQNSPGQITLNNATLRNTIVGNAGTFSPVARVINLGAGGGTLEWPGTANPADLIIVQTNTQITGVGGLTKTGAGIIAAVGPLTYQGPTRVAQGILRVRTNDNAFPTGTALTVDAGATFDLGTASLDQQVGSLSGAGTVNVPGGIFTVGNTTSTTFTGVIQGASGRLTKVGTGMLSLGGPNSYTGATTVNNGTLAIQAGGSLVANSAVTVNAAGMLAGVGTVNGSVTVNPGGAIRGDITGGTGTLTASGGVTLNSSGVTDGIFRFEASRTGVNTALASRLAVTGQLNLNPGAGNRFTLDLVNGTTPLVADETYTVTLATVGTAGDIRLNGSGLAANQVIDGSNYSLRSDAFSSFSNVSLGVDGAGTALVLSFTPVPEPASVIGLAAATFGLGQLVRRVRGRVAVG